MFLTWQWYLPKRLNLNWFFELIFYFLIQDQSKLCISTFILVSLTLKLSILYKVISLLSDFSSCWAKPKHWFFGCFQWKIEFCPKLSWINYHNLNRKLLFLYPPEEMRCLWLSLYFWLKNRSHALLCSEKCKRFVSEKCRATHNILKMLGFYSMYFSIFC